MTTSTPSRSPEDRQAAERQALLDAALAVLREHGTQGLKVDHVLAEAGLGTRAFYRHFDSKDRLVVAVFADAAQAEADRLRRRMPADADPVSGVTAWIDGRLDLAFDAGIQSDLQSVSRQAQALHSIEPDAMAGMHAAMLGPLIEQLQAGLDAGTFSEIDPVAAAISIDAVTWRFIEKERTTGDGDRDDVRAQVLGFCLRGLGAR